MREAVREEMMGLVPEIVPAVLSTMLGVDAIPVSVPRDLLDRITASIHITGEREIGVFIDLSRSQAREFMSRYLDMAAPPEIDDVVRDTLGEVANVIAGNLKSVVAPRATLSMPAVVDGKYNMLRPQSIPEGHAETHAFLCNNEVLCVSWVVSGPAGD